MNKESYNNEELLKKLKATIEKLKFQNKQGNKINSQADMQISKNNSIMKMKQEEIKNLNEKVNTLNKELQIIKSENKSLLEQMKLKQQENSKGNLMNQRLIAEINNLKENNKVLEECLKDRRKTIMELKQSLKILSGIKDDEGMGDFNQGGSNLNDKKKRLAELINESKQKSKQLIDIKKNYMDMINMKDERIKELKEKMEKMGIVE